MPRMPICQVVYAGVVEYLAAWEAQRAIVNQVREGVLPNTLLLLEHPPVYTIGRRGSRDQVLLDDGQLIEHGVSLHEVDRGGQVTYHGPGQLVAYPVLDLSEWGGPVKYVPYSGAGNHKYPGGLRPLQRAGRRAHRGVGPLPWVAI